MSCCQNIKPPLRPCSVTCAKLTRRGGLVRVQQIAAQADAGIFTSSEKATAADQKASLQARVQAVRSALEKVRAELSVLQRSAACRVMFQHPDWDAYFQSQATKLDQEIKRLADAVEDSET